MKYCLNCKQNVEPELKGGVDYKGLLLVLVLSTLLGNLWIILLVVLVGVILQGIYGGGPKDVCPICKSNNFMHIPQDKKKDAKLLNEAKLGTTEKMIHKLLN